jgi:hypothetical protein
MTLDHAALFAATLPEGSAWVLEVLFELDQLREGPARTLRERRERAELCYRQILAGLESAREATPPEHDRDSESFRLWFTEAVLLWMRFARIGSAPRIDTLGARPLQAFPVDLPPAPEVAAHVAQAVGRAYGWTPDELSAIERRVAHATSNLELKQRITRALADYLSQDGRLEAPGRLGLMREFYGDVPFRPGEVDVLIAETALFFFVPRKGNALDVPDFKQRSAPEQAAVLEFFAKVDRHNIAETRRFPAFGLYEPERLSAELLERLASATAAPAEVVRATLSTMFALIPSGLHAQYLVHDLWGHTWQEALNEFEAEYALLPGLDQPLHPSAGPEFGGEGTPSLGSSFSASNGRTVLDEVRLLTFAEADLRGRIRVGVSVALSEVLADFMEAKFSRARPALELPTSSLIRSTSLKMDLTIADMRAQVRRYTRPYRKLAVDASTRAQFARELEALGLPRPGLEEAVSRAGRAIWLAFSSAFDDSLAPEPAEGAAGLIRSSVLRRLLLQFALFMTDLEKALGSVGAEAAAREAWRDPATCPDFVAVAFMHFYELDRSRNFWHLDQLARNDFTSACERLKRALQS